MRHPHSTPWAVNNQLARFCRAAGMSHQVTHTEHLLYGIRHVIAGVTYTPGAAADRFLPGGFTGAYGKPPKTPALRVGQTLHRVHRGDALDAEVIEIVGAPRYEDGFRAILRARPSDTSGCATTVYLTVPA